MSTEEPGLNAWVPGQETPGVDDAVAADVVEPAGSGHAASAPGSKDGHDECGGGGDDQSDEGGVNVLGQARRAVGPRQPNDERDRVGDGEERGRPANRPIAGVAESADQRDRDRDARQQGDWPSTITGTAQEEMVTAGGVRRSVRAGDVETVVMMFPFGRESGRSWRRRRRARLPMEGRGEKPSPGEIAGMVTYVMECGPDFGDQKIWLFQTGEVAAAVQLVP